MTPTEALAAIRSKGFRIWSDGKSIQIEPEPDARRLAWINANQAALLDALRAEAAPATNATYVDASDLIEDAREYYEERAAIAEYDGALPRDDAERQAVQLTAVYFKLIDNEGGGWGMGRDTTFQVLADELRRRYGERLLLIQPCDSPESSE